MELCHSKAAPSRMRPLSASSVGGSGLWRDVQADSCPTYVVSVKNGSYTGIYSAKYTKTTLPWRAFLYRSVYGRPEPMLPSAYALTIAWLEKPPT